MIEVVLDTETTGLEVKDGHRIVEIGCIELQNQIPTSRKFHCYLNPERKVSEKALEVHGYTDKFLESKQKFLEIADEFLNFIENKKLIIHNSVFDLSHLNNELVLAGKKKLDKIQVIDTLDLAKDKFPGSQINLDALCKKFRIDNSKREKHNAIIDCELLSKVYINLLNEREPSFNFSKTNNLLNENSIREKFKYYKKIIIPSEHEKKLHSQYLKKEIKKNYYN